MFLCRKLKPFNNCYLGNPKSLLFSCETSIPWNKTSSSSSTTASNPVCIPFSSAISTVLMESGDSFSESLPAVHTSLLVAQTLTNLKRKPDIALAIFRCFQEQGFRHDIFTCSVIVRILCDSGQRKKLVSFLSEMLSSNEYLSFDLPALFDVLYQGNSSFDSLSLLFDSIIKAYASCDRGGLAMEAFFELTRAGYRPSLKSCNFLMNLMAQGSDLDMVMAVYHCMKRFKIDPSVHTFTILIKATCSSGNLEQASNILEEMVQAGVTPDLMAYTTFIGALCECGKPDIAFDFLKIIGNQGVNSLAYNKVISAFCKQMRLEEAEKVLETMLQQDVLPDTFSYNCLIKVLCAKGNLLKAACLLKEMESAGIPHDRFTATFIVQGFCKFEKICDALQYFKKFKDSAMFLDGAAYNAAMCAWCKIGKMERAMDLFQEMIDVGLFPDKMHFTTLIYGYCCNGKIDSAWNLLMQMFNAKLEPDLVTYNVLASGICRNGSVSQEAHDLLELMWQRRVAPNATTYGIFIEGLCRQGSLEEAEILFNELEGRGIAQDTPLFSSMVSGYLEHGYTEKACELFIRLVKQGNLVYEFTSSRLIKELCTERNFDRACNAVDHMLNAFISSAVIPCTNVIAAYCHIGAVDNARIWFDKWVTRGLLPDVVLYTTIMHGYCKALRVQDARNLFSEMEVKGIKPDVIAFTVMLDGHVQEYLVKHHFNLEMESTKLEFKAKLLVLVNLILKSMQLMEIDADEVLYTVLIKAHCKMHDLQEACKLFDEMKTKRVLPDSYTYTSLVCGFCHQGEVDMAAKLLEEMLGRGIVPDEPIALSSFVRVNMRSNQSHCNLLSILK